MPSNGHWLDGLPDNRILSHDLLEGCYARAGLISDVQLYEEYPSQYRADVSRRHRWIRGDLADRPLAVAGYSHPQCAPEQKSAVAAVALEDLRQPAAQPDGLGVDPPAAVGLDGAAGPWILDLWR